MSATTSQRGAHSAVHPAALPGPRPRPLPPPRPVHTAVGQLHAARTGLAEAAEATSPAVRYVCAHLAALRAAAAVLASKEPLETHRRGRPRSVWVLLPEAEPALREWAAFFAAGADKRAAAEAGLPRAVTGPEADELLRDAEVFVTLVEDTLGVIGQPTLPVPDVRAG
ncbi:MULTISPECIES: SAV_6107 family HEPN domain-containing protein [Thermomonosporaceae]|uniref:SAV_6107 family HEPN domain-containing protein n=1 Tax=Thermomonosporaceae TaxID=2012 RepID=UPI00255AA91D|nr:MULTISPECIES: SAV_6107 family HEPN domain-containing protein [Thermomonosporaceae]MDL4771129.1 SAV_6107 family HEPN domain-containing protein [Actinomadura xylanilytica]